MSGNFGVNVKLAYVSIDEAFPKLDPGNIPLGNKVLFQMKRAISRTASGIELPPETVQAENANTQVAKVIAAGPLAFHNRNTGETWPEGAWVKVGDYCRVPKYGGDKFTVRTKDKSEVEFRLYDDLQILTRVTGDPLGEQHNAYV